MFMPGANHKVTPSSIISSPTMEPASSMASTSQLCARWVAMGMAVQY